MEKEDIQKEILEKLYRFKPPKWGASHTEGRNLFKGLPKHIIGTKISRDALKELVKKEFLLKFMKTGEWHYSLNPEKKKEIEELINERRYNI